MGIRSSKEDRASNPISRLQQQENKMKINEEKERKLQEKRKKKQKKNKKKFENKKKTSKKSSDSNQRKPINQMEYENSVCLKLRDQIDNDLSVFVLNQMVLSVQFFSNYDRIRTNIYNENLELEKTLNENLTDHSIMLQNAVDKSIEQRIQFKHK